MKRLSRTSNNRALLVLCALGLLCASSSLVSAQDGRTSKSERGAADFDGDYSGKMKSKENKNKPVVRPEGKRDPSPARPGIDTQSAKGSGRLTVRKILIPGNDPGKFNLIIDGVVKAFAVGHNGTTGTIVVNTGAHNGGEMAGTSITNLANYTTVIGGDCSPNGNISLAADQSKTCTITNTRKKPPTPLTEAPFQPGGAFQEVPPVQPHGSWTQGPGTYTFKVCAEGTTGAPCNIKGAPGQSIPITIEAWGGGGGGGGGMESFGHTMGGGGYGGGGGGGGGYAKTTIAAVVPSSGALTYFVKVGAGGAKGLMVASPSPARNGGDGGFTEVRMTNAGGPVILKATGGLRGSGYTGCPGGCGGAGGSGTINNSPGSPGGAGGSGSTCNGHAGGGGGAGGGPGSVNNGGNGGHGGYYHSVVYPTCTAASNNYGRTEGSIGGNGKVNFVW